MPLANQFPPLSPSLFEAISHEDLDDMPDTGGTNSDHDARYIRKQEIESYLSDANTKAWWKFEETTNGASFADSSGNGNTMLNGGVQEGSAILYGYAIYFDGVTDYCKTASLDSSLQIATNLTVECIVYPNDSGSGALISCMDSTLATQVGYELSDDGTNIRFIIAVTGATYTASANKAAIGYTTSKAYHIRATYDGSNIKLYLLNYTDGDTQFTLVDTEPASGSIIYNTGTYDTIALGAKNFVNNPPNGQDHYKGRMDQVAISNVVRTYDYGYEDITPSVADVSNLGNRILRFDGVYGNVLYGDTIIGNLENFKIDDVYFVSPTFIENSESQRYNTIQAGIDAASSGSVVFVYPGTYTEQITIKAGVTIKGLDKTNCILQRSSKPIADVDIGANSFFIENMTINATTANTTVMELLSCTSSFPYNINNCNFSGQIYVNASSITNHAKLIFSNTIINSNHASDEQWTIRVTGNHATYQVQLNFWNESNLLSGWGVFWDAWHTNRWEGSLSFINSHISQGSIKIDPNTGTLDATHWAPMLSVTGSRSSSDTPGDSGDSFMDLTTNSNINIVNNSFSTDGMNGIKFSSYQPFANVKNITGNIIKVTTGYDIRSDTAINMVINNNIMSLGMNGNIQLDGIRNINGSVDFYKTIQDALDSIVSDNQKVVLKEDQTITSALTPPSYSIMIDGLHQFSIIRSAGNPLMTLSAGDDVKFVNIDLIGSIDVTGNATKLHLADHTLLTGMIDIQSGDGSSEIKIDQCKIIGDASDNYCIRIADADPIIIIKRAYLKANGANPAIYYDTITNDNLKVAYATINHGSLGANNPFGRSGAQTPDYCSHHSLYNDDPESGAIFTNLIAAPLDVFDVNGDY